MRVEDLHLVTSLVQHVCQVLFIYTSDTLRASFPAINL